MPITFLLRDRLRQGVIRAFAIESKGIKDMDWQRVERVEVGTLPSGKLGGAWPRVVLGGWFAVAALAAWGGAGQVARGDEYDLAIATLQQTEENNASNQRAVEAARKLQGARPAVLLRVLEGMKRSTPVGKNYLSGVAGTLFQRDSIYLRSQLESFLLDTTQDGEARYLVFEWLTEGQESLRDQMLEGFRDDPSLELRHAAIGRAIDRLDKAPELSMLRKLLDQARHPAQIESLAKKLKEAGETVDQAKVFGFLMTWDAIGPFDNQEQKHFHTVYPVERDLLGKPFDPSLKYSGKSGELVGSRLLPKRRLASWTWQSPSTRRRGPSFMLVLSSVAPSRRMSKSAWDASTPINSGSMGKRCLPTRYIMRGCRSTSTSVA
jgi:hypothetical protein